MLGHTVFNRNIQGLNVACLGQSISVHGVVEALSGLFLPAIQVFPVKNFQVFPGFTTAGICLKSRARVNGAIQSHFTFVEVDLQQVWKIGRKR